MSTATSQPFVPLEDFLEMTPDDGMRLEWSAGLVVAMSGGSTQRRCRSLSLGRSLAALATPLSLPRGRSRA